MDKQFQSQLKISEPYVLEKKELENQGNHYITKDQFFIELFRDLWYKEEILLMVLVLVESQFMDINLKMKIF